MRYQFFFSTSGLLLFFLLNSFAFAATNKMFFSKRYIPIYNPGGESFYSDADFAGAYSIYEKRRKVFIDSLDVPNSHTVKSKALSQEMIAKKLNSYGILPEAANVNKKASKSKLGDMVNSRGIDLSRLKGAKFIKIDDNSWNNNSQLLRDDDKDIFSEIPGLDKNITYSERLKKKLRAASQKRQVENQTKKITARPENISEKNNHVSSLANVKNIEKKVISSSADKSKK